MPPWEKYAPAVSSDAGPWAKYGGGTDATEPAKDDSAVDKMTGLAASIPGQMREAVGGVAEPLMAMGSGAVGKFAGDVAGLGAIPMHAMGLTGEPQDVQKRVRSALTYEPRTELGKSPYNPLNAIPQGIGKGMDALAGGAESMTAPPGSGPLRSAIGSGVGEAVRQAPAFIGMKAPAAAEAASGALRSGAERSMSSALKPGEKALRAGKSDIAVDTMLDQGLNVSKGGLQTMRDRISTLNDQIASKIESSPAIIDKKAVASRLDELTEKFIKKADPMDDLKNIQKAWDALMDHPFFKGEGIPIKGAQEMKQATTKGIGDAAYGSMKTSEIEAQKQIARGLKEEIAKAVPEVRPLNAEESKLLTALPLVEKRVLMEAQKNPIGLGLISSSPSHMALWLADRSALFKSLVAHMLNTGSKAMAPAGRAGPPIGMAITGQTDQPAQ